MEPIGEAMAALQDSSTKGRTLSELFEKARERIAAESGLAPEERHARLVERMQARADAYNRTPGKLKDGYTISAADGGTRSVEGDGYDCKLCLNRGDTLHFRDTGSGLQEYMVPCKCMEIRKSIWRMKRSGLEKSIRENKFERFDVNENWQQMMVDLARRYLNDGVKDGRWLYFGGQPGSGKTHICTAVAGKLLYEKPVIYAVWPQISKKLKAIVNEADEYEREISKLQQIDVLYFDDFFKPVTDSKGIRQPPTPADMKLAFDILNYRYINKLPTILSSEWFLAELADMDEATASRIAERCGDFAMMIGRDRSRNHRFAMSTVV